jgi:hypothetical protein
VTDEPEDYADYRLLSGANMACIFRLRVGQYLDESLQAAHDRGMLMEWFRLADVVPDATSSRPDGLVRVFQLTRTGREHLLYLQERFKVGRRTQ